MRQNNLPLLGLAVNWLGRQPEPYDRFLAVLRNALTKRKTESKVI